ncbi:MAG: hypothetical protein U1F52_17600 [Burkholderiales bacterium]
MPPPILAFAADPIAFMKNNIVYPGGLVPTHQALPAQSGIYQATLIENTNLTAYKGKVNPSKTIRYYNLVQPNNGDAFVRIYWLRFESNAAHGMALGHTVNDPKFMFTVRQNSCTLGYAQATQQQPAFVSHHNAAAQGNSAAVIEGQNIQWSGGAVPNTNMNFAHRDEYMKDTANPFYGSTTFGVRDAAGKWHFYFQKSKGHGYKHDNLSLKGVTEIETG